MQKIHAKEHTLRDIFSDNFQFIVPLYQRPYSWTTEQAGALLSDLLDAMKRESGPSDYFLGSVVLVKKENQPELEIIDGQQRITTLTILLATLRDLFESNPREELHRMIWQEGKELAGTEARIRLQIRSRDDDYFRRNIQDKGAIKILVENRQIVAHKGDAQNNLRKNAEHFWAKLQPLSESERKKLGAFLVQHCYLVVVSTADLSSAYRTFSIMNTRGLDLESADILKAEIIGELDASERESYTKKWEDIETLLTREHFSDLFEHIRMIFRKQKQREYVVDELREAVNLGENPKGFLDGIFEPMANAYRQIKYSDFDSDFDSENGQVVEINRQVAEINRYLRLLNRLDNKDWIPAAILFVTRHNGDFASVLRFLKSLEKSAYGMFVLRRNINERIRRYARVLSKIEGGNIGDVEASLNLSSDEKSKVREALDADIYNTTKIRSQILERIDDALTEGGTNYPHLDKTIEHVLPQNPTEGSKWCENFDEEQREKWTHRIANLVLLSGRKNSSASNREFGEKKKNYLRRGGMSPFALTVLVQECEEWTPAVLEERQNWLLQQFDEIWDLGGAS